MADVLYQLPADQVADLATITVDVGTDDTTYTRANLVDGNIAKPAKLAEVTGTWKFDFGAAQRVDVLALGPHNFDAGLTVKLQANATDAWGTPTVDAAVTIPADEADGRAVCPWLDVTAASGYSSGGFRYWRLHVSGTNSVALQLGEVWLGATKRLLATAMGHNYRWPFEISESRRLIEHVTDYGVATVYDLQTRTRVFRGDLRLSDTGLTAFLTWVRAMKGRVDAGIWIPDSTVNDAWWVRHVRDFTIRRRFTNLNEVPLVLDELSHGLPL